MAGVIGRADAGAAQDDAAGREVGTGHKLDQAVDGNIRIFQVGEAGVDHLAKIMRRDVRRHADSDAAGAVDEQVGKPRRQDQRLLQRLVVVGLKIDGFLVDVLKQRFARLGETRFGIPHGGRRIAVHRTEIALAVDQRQAHGKILHHADHGVIDRGVAVRMVLAHDVADDRG
jgi:hypothetical protein